MSGYRRLTERATTRGWSATDLLALARRNDLADDGRLMRSDQPQRLANRCLTRVSASTGWSAFCRLVR